MVDHLSVSVLYPDEGACAAYRLLWPGRALAAQGADVTVAPINSIAATAVTQDGIERIVEVHSPSSDVIVIQRPLDANVADAVQLWRADGKTVIVDIDDHFHAVHPDNVAAHSIDPKRNPGSNTTHLRRAIEACSLVTVTTSALADFYGRWAPCAVIPNCVPDEWLDTPPAFTHDGVWVGWTGTRAVHPTDLEVTGGAVARAVRESGAEMAVVGNAAGVANALDLDAPINQTGLVPLEQYPSLYACFDVAIAPLADTEFNRAKSRIKPLEAATVGVPCVMSDLPEYRAAANAGIGLIARRYADWHKHLSRLIASADYRAETGGRGREAVEQFTVSRNTPRWYDAWRFAAARTRKRSA